MNGGPMTEEKRQQLAEDVDDFIAGNFVIEPRLLGDEAYDQLFENFVAGWKAFTTDASRKKLVNGMEAVLKTIPDNQRVAPRIFTQVSNRSLKHKIAVLVKNDELGVVANYYEMLDRGRQ